jgi:glycosyltransferase involved in cell wall biosynthesis
MNSDINVAVIVPCYNQAQYMDEALISVLNQTYTNWECIIVNDGSTDNTEETGKKWASTDHRFKYIYQKNKGLSSARNYGIEHTNAKYILPLDCDDKISADYLMLAIAAFKMNESLKVVYCKAEKFGAETGAWNLPAYSHQNLCNMNMIFCTAVFKKSDWNLVGGYDAKMINGLEDWEFWIAILKNGGEVMCLNAVCFFYRIRKHSMIRSIDTEKRIRLKNYLLQKHFYFYINTYNSTIQQLEDDLRLDIDPKEFGKYGTAYTKALCNEASWMKMHNGSPPHSLSIFFKNALDNCNYIKEVYIKDEKLVTDINNLVAMLRQNLITAERLTIKKIGFTRRKKLFVKSFLSPGTYSYLTFKDKLRLLFT